MTNREELTWKIWESEGMGRALLIGGLIAYIPLVNLLLLGYYGRWVSRLVRQEGMALPEWSEGRHLLEELARVILPALVWIFLPVMLAGLLSWSLFGIFDFLHLGFFGPTLSLLPLALVAVLSPPAMTLALLRLYRTDAVRESLEVARILREVIRRLRSCLFPLFQFYGILALGWPLAGFAGFLATLPLLAQLVLIFRETGPEA